MADESLSTIGAQIPASLQQEVERIAHRESEPGWRNVAPSHVVRAALRHYIEEYDRIDGTAFEDGEVRKDDEPTLAAETGVEANR